jgi:capsular exopolysaccharide synthesis family protein
VLIEADLRRPMFAQGFSLDGTEPSSVGLSNYLVGSATMDEVVVRHPTIDGLSIVWSGPSAPSALPLLRSEMLANLIDRLKDSYDWVIVDTPPVLLGADASIIVARANAAIFVVDAASTTAQSASIGLTQLRKVDPTFLALVLNRVSTPDFSDYYGSSDAEQSLNGRGLGRVGTGS